MSKLSHPRHGSLQFYPRKRIGKFIPSVNWSKINSKEQGVLGFITYKVGMASALLKDNTENSMTKGKRITVPVTILEAPNMKIFSIRFYKNSKVLKEIVITNDKELKRKIKVPKILKNLEKTMPQEYEDIRILVYSLPKQTAVKKTPDFAELAVSGSNKLDFIKSLANKEITIADFLKNNIKLFDVRGLTKGKGNQGPVRRFGITLKFHKSEKGQRNPGSLAPWHPARVTFRTPIAGQLGLFTRVHYNSNLIASGRISESDINPPQGFRGYGRIRSSYLLLKGSVQGPAKRQILVTPALRPTKAQNKKKFEFISLQ